MGLSKKEKKRLKKSAHLAKVSAKQQVTPLPVQIVPLPPKKGIWASLSRRWKIFWQLVVGLSILLVVVPPIYEYFKKDKRKFEESKFEENDVKPTRVAANSNEGQSIQFDTKPVFSNDPALDSLPKANGFFIRRESGSQGLTATIGKSLIMIPYELLEEGTEVPVSTEANCAKTSSIYLILKDNLLYVTTKFWDIDNGQYVGSINYNHWKINTKNLLTWDNDYDKLEVRDNKGNIIFLLDTKDGNGLTIAGYFINPNSIWVLGNEKGKKTDTCFSLQDSNWKQKALVKILNIHPIFKKKVP